MRSEVQILSPRPLTKSLLLRRLATEPLEQTARSEAAAAAAVAIAVNQVFGPAVGG